MSKNKNQNKSAILTQPEAKAKWDALASGDSKAVDALVAEVIAESGAALAVMNAPMPPAESGECQTVIIRPVSQVAALFTVEGERLTLKQGVTAPSADEFADFIADRVNDATTANSHAAYALYEASKVSPLVFNSTATLLGLKGLSQSAINNLKSVCVRVIPLQVEQGYKAPVSLIKDAVAAIKGLDGKLRTTEESVVLQRAFKSGVNPDGVSIMTKNGMKDVSGQPITTQSIRAIRDKYDKDGALKVVAVPVEDKPTVEVRSASASNATGEPATAETGAVQPNEPAKALANAVNLANEKPNSAGSVPVTVGAPVAKSGAMTEGELIVAAFESLANRFSAYTANHSFLPDERAALLIVAGKVAKHFGAELLGV